MDKAKLDVIHDYLSEAFVGLTIEEQNDFDLMVQKYRVVADDRTYRLHVSSEFVFDTAIDEIASKIRAWDIEALMRTPDIHGVSIGNRGPELSLGD